jgi:hypothetical protein
MPEMIERTDSLDATTESLAAAVRPSQWTRTYTIWTLIVLSLLPGVGIAMFRAHWLDVPAGLKAAVYLTSALLILAAVGLIIRGDDRRPDDS